MRSLNLSMIIAVVFVFFSCGRGGIGDAAQDNRSPAPQKPTVIIGGDAKGRTVHPGEKAAIQNAGAEIWLDGDEISKATKFGINTLAPGDLAKLEGGMTNVTGGADSGYRFTPTPTTFNKQLYVVLPYNPALLPDGMTAQDVKTYYYDTAAERWIALERVHLDTSKNLVVSTTNHFTDMINATVVVPETRNCRRLTRRRLRALKPQTRAQGLTSSSRRRRITKATHGFHTRSKYRPAGMVLSRS